MKTHEELVSLGIDGFKADEIMKLQEKMMEQAVKFQFKKKDGSIRDALGTLKRALMVQEDGTIWEPKGESKPEPASIIRFFDVEKGLWRCFTCTEFIGLVEG
jgi:hypothetical protein